MFTQHTPGPWSLQPIGDETECNILGAGRELIATVSDNDAPIIAAAPDLLAALQAIADAGPDEGCKMGDGWRAAHDKFTSFARAAIAKARGE